ncbi:MAG: bifunctional glutamate N-acetyltransferase/amino-acid acetyltransferase ArgJ [Gammaproteobacteria bacterium]|nr:bifunctional glutamate N-acetyltransferase/amino-acid acetyltransferase ArgJ [Gammaproteobacteria bacterium]MBQ0838296.1 bifunctional glutamate N-acetyltransferase/amino-acid acetyltransferase ArgJ [Gammaproteobacteria bacterium]
MAVGSGELPPMFPVKGFRLATGCAGIKVAGRKDLVIMALAEGSEIAAVFTRNAFCAAPVQVAKAHLGNTSIADRPSRYLLTNTGNANAGTGEQGLRDAQHSCASLAAIAGVETSQILPFSTGVIGEPLPMEALLGALPATFDTLNEDGWADAAEGILTTDTRPKGASRQIDIQGEVVTITGITKGAGMIRPDMATMLAYVATDAQCSSEYLQQALNNAVNKSFNRITIDGDTSTNDSLVLVATGQSGPALSDECDLAVLNDAIEQVCIELAQAIVRDGEGATKFVTVELIGGASVEECLKVAYTVADSPLVKTALFASDPNWGRILMAIGRAGVADLDVEKIKVWLDDVLIAEHGGRAATYTEQAGQQVMDKEELTIRIDLARGSVSETVWTTDLSYDYIRINAEYRT